MLEKTDIKLNVSTLYFYLYMVEETHKTVFLWVRCHHTDVGVASLNTHPCTLCAWICPDLHHMG